MGYDPGRMRHLADFNGPTRTPDGAGGYTTTPAAADATLRGVSIELNPLRGNERLRGMQLTADPSHEVRMWYSALVNSNMTMTVDGVTYAIVSNVVSPNEENELLEFLVRKQAVVS